MWFLKHVLVALVLLTGFLSLCVKAEDVQPGIISTKNKDYFGFRTKFTGYSCEATGTNLQFSWRHNDIPVTAKYFLKFPKTHGSTLQPINENIIGEYQGTYQCFVNNSVGQIFGRQHRVEFTVIGTFKKKIPPVSEIQDVVVGRPYPLHCPEHEKSNRVKFRWEYVEGDTPTSLAASPRHFVTSNGTLYFTAISEQDIKDIEDKGGVRCVQFAKQDGETRAKSSHLVLLRKKPGSAVESRNFKPVMRTVIGTKSVIFGEKSVSLTCGATGKPPPVLTWYKENSKPADRQELKPGRQDYKLGRYNQILTVKDVSASKAGHYVCVANNSVGSVETRGKIIVADRPQWRVGGELKDVQPAIQSRFVWECAALGGATYYWYKNGERLSKSNAARLKYEIKESDGKSQLIFKKISTENNGMYQCTASNEKDIIYATGRLKAKVTKPKFLEEMGPVTLIRTKKGLISCPVDAAPLPTITWSKNGLKIDYNDRFQLAKNKLDLTIMNVTDADAGRYTCHAENSLGTDEDSSLVRVGADITIDAAPVDNRNVTKEFRFELDCRATGDPSYEVKYQWLRNGLPLEYTARIHWVKEEHRLVILDALVSDSGTYTCIAFADTPLRIEKKMNAEIIVRAAPNPPDRVYIVGNCWTKAAEVVWQVGSQNNEEIYYFLIQWSTTYNSSNWIELPRVLRGDFRLKLDFSVLPPYSRIYFRVIAVNRIGQSDPSEPSDPSTCITSPAAPPYPPGEIRAVARGANTMRIEWTPVEQMYWGAAGFNYSLQWRRKTGDDSESRWNILPSSQDIRIYDGNNNSVEVQNPGYYNEWEFRIRSNNHYGSSPEWKFNFGFSGQDPPTDKPTGLTPGTVSARSAEISWVRVRAPRNGTIDGYRIQYWHSVIGLDVAYRKDRRKKRDAPEEEEEDEVEIGCFDPNDPCVQDAPEKESQLNDLQPYKTYHVRIAAYNSGGLGPMSDEMTFNTAEAFPGPPYSVMTYAYGRYCKLTWKEPRHKNGEILEYKVYGDGVSETILPWWQRRHIIYNLNYGTTYEAKLRARTKSGWGVPVYRWFQTTSKQKLAKPLPPEVLGYGEDGVNVTFQEPKPILLRKYCCGEMDEDPWELRPVGGFDNEHRGDGAYPERFYVVYRKADTNDAFMKSDMKQMYDERDQTWVVIENLEPFQRYEFATVPINSGEEGPKSDFVYGLPGGIVPKVAKLHWYQRDWFIALVVLFGAAILLLLIVLFGTRHLKRIYYEGAPKRRKDRERERIFEPEDVDGGFNEFTLKSARSSRSVVTSRSGPPPPYSVTNGSTSRHSGDFDDDEELDSDVDDEKHEVSTYYSDEKKVPLDDLDDDDEEASRLATFV